MESNGSYVVRKGSDYINSYNKGLGEIQALTYAKDCAAHSKADVYNKTDGVEKLVFKYVEGRLEAV